MPEVSDVINTDLHPVVILSLAGERAPPPNARPCQRHQAGAYLRAYLRLKKRPFAGHSEPSTAHREGPVKGLFVAFSTNAARTVLPAAHVRSPSRQPVVDRAPSS